jgi:hypothetical protein
VGNDIVLNFGRFDLYYTLLYGAAKGDDNDTNDDYTDQNAGLIRGSPRLLSRHLPFTADIRVALADATSGVEIHSEKVSTTLSSEQTLWLVHGPIYRYSDSFAVTLTITITPTQPIVAKPPRISDEGHLGTVLFEQMKRGAGCDATLCVQYNNTTERIGAHRLVLEAQCPYFAAAGRWTPYTTDTVIVGRMPAAVRTVLHYLYITRHISIYELVQNSYIMGESVLDGSSPTSTVDWSTHVSLMLDIVLLADYLNLGALMHNFEHQLIAFVTPENVGDVMVAVSHWMHTTPNITQFLSDYCALHLGTICTAHLSTVTPAVLQEYLNYTAPTN